MDVGEVEVPYQRRDGDRIICEICPVHCRLKEGQAGLCRGRAVVDGRLLATNYGQLVALHLDPIEKKPLYHVFPGSRIWSAGPNGCNLFCRWCQNCDISQHTALTRFMEPDELSEYAMTRGSVGLAYTYTEPLIWYETVRDTAPRISAKGGINVLVTNGYVDEEPLRALAPWIDAANVDLKFMDEEYYHKYTGGELEVVQRSIRILHEEGVHVEVTHLMVTGITDAIDQVKRLADWVAGVNPDIPLHLSRYFPHHRWHEPPTPVGTLLQAKEEAERRLSFVYLGNLLLENGSNTICPDCGSVAVRRSGGWVDASGLDEAGGCAACGRPLNFRLS